VSAQSYRQVGDDLAAKVDIALEHGAATARPPGPGGSGGGLRGQQMITLVTCALITRCFARSAAIQRLLPCVDVA